MTDNSLSKWFVISGLIVMGFLILYTMRSFLDGFLGAVTMYVLARPYMEKLISKNWKKGRAAALILVICIVILVIPTTAIVSLIVPKLSSIFSNGSLTLQSLQNADKKIYELTGFTLITPENISRIQSSVTGYITGFLGQSIDIITDIALLFFFLYYLLINVGRNEKFLNRIIPLSQERLGGFAKELESQTRSNALGIPLLATVQGVFSCIGYWIFGLPDPLFWGFMTGVFSILPVIGSAVVWIPAGLFLISSGATWPGIGVIIYGAIVIGTVDNLYRLLFLKLFADVHPMVTIVGIIVGVQLFGFPGLIFGPLLISYFILFFKIFQEDKSGQTS